MSTLTGSSEKIVNIEILKVLKQFKWYLKNKDLNKYIHNFWTLIN